MEKGTFLKLGRGALVFKYAFGLFISLHHDFLGSSFSHGGEFFLSRRIFLSLTKSIFLSHGGNLSLTQRVFLSLTEHTDVTELFHQRFEPTERLRHTDITEAFQLTLAVTFCVIG